MVDSHQMKEESTDPRIRRTRELLYSAFAGLLAEKSFEEISVQDIAERSTLNRATFYDHFPDKFALVESMIGENFLVMLTARMDGSPGTCRESAKRLILALCDFLTDLASRCQKHQRQFEPLMESKIKSVVREFLLEGLRKKMPDAKSSDLELRATMASWAVCGAALGWSRQRTPAAETFVESVLPLIAPTLEL
ncbi:MAG: TetR/AcrR family transcriptional regulator [Terrimicrobiaceae bacterium]